MPEVIAKKTKEGEKLYFKSPSISYKFKGNKCTAKELVEGHSASIVIECIEDLMYMVYKLENAREIPINHLMKMTNQPVWVEEVFIDEDGGLRTQAGWDILRFVNKEEGEEWFGFTEMQYKASTYGKDWKCFTREPKIKLTT